MLKACHAKSSRANSLAVVRLLWLPIPRATSFHVLLVSTFCNMKILGGAEVVIHATNSENFATRHQFGTRPVARRVPRII